MTTPLEETLIKALSDNEYVSVSPSESDAEIVNADVWFSATEILNTVFVIVGALLVGAVFESSEPPPPPPPPHEAMTKKLTELPCLKCS